MFPHADLESLESKKPFKCSNASQLISNVWPLVSVYAHGTKRAGKNASLTFQPPFWFTTQSRFAVPLLPTPAPRKIGCYFSVVCLNSSRISLANNAQNLKKLYTPSKKSIIQK